jgi:uridine kinase
MIKKPLVITIAGGTASGKTTIAEAIKDDILSKKMSASLVTLDDYYLDGEDAQKFFNNQEID